MSDFIEAYLAISAVKAKYCRTLDTKDWDSYRECFTEDFELDTRPSGGNLVQGREAAIAMTRGAVGEAITAHQVHSPEIKLNGDTADVIWAMQDRVVWPAERANALGHASLTGFGHYHERYVRKDGQWRIAKLKLTRLHMDMHPLA